MKIADQLAEALTEAKPKHSERESGGGRFSKTPPCDACGKPVGTDFMTDDEVVGSGDGPGFFLCDRKRCAAKRDQLDVPARKAMYAAQRAKNNAK